MKPYTLAKSVQLTDLGFAVNRYRHATPGVYVCLCVPVLLEGEPEYVPGLVAAVNHGRLRQCEPTERGFEGPPNFILDIFDSSELDEYEARRSAFGRAGVVEYVAVFVDTGKCRWNRHDGTAFELVDPDERGTLKSKALPGLWFSTSQTDGEKGWSLVSQIEEGMSRIGHHELMETIWHTKGRDPEWGDWMPFDAG